MDVTLWIKIIGYGVDGIVIAATRFRRRSGGRAFIAKMNIVDNRMRDEAIEMIFNRTAFENFFQIFASQIRDW